MNATKRSSAKVEAAIITVVNPHWRSLLPFSCHVFADYQSSTLLYDTYTNVTFILSRIVPFALPGSMLG